MSDELPVEMDCPALTPNEINVSPVLSTVKVTPGPTSSGAIETEVYGIAGPLASGRVGAGIWRCPKAASIASWLLASGDEPEKYGDTIPIPQITRDSASVFECAVRRPATP